nr:MAG TPA: hypothetical protein [Caudoviricetes sp.]
MRSKTTALCCTCSHKPDYSQSFFTHHKIALSFQTIETIGRKYV